MNIAVAGTGYVGMSIATLLAQHNHVTAVDVIPEKVEKINNRISPIQDDYIEKYLAEKELVDTPLDEEVSCLDIDEVVRVSIGDRDVRKYLQERYGIADSIKVQELEKEKRNEILIEAIQYGAPLRQLSRLTGISYGVIQRINAK